MTLNEIFIIVAIILIVIDIFFASDIPTHIAYIIFTYLLAKEIELSILYQILFGVLIWFALVVIHYLIWKNIIEKINDRLIAPNKHKDGLDIFIGEKGLIKEIDGELFICIKDEILPFETNKQVKVGEKHEIIKTKSNTLII